MILFGLLYLVYFLICCGLVCIWLSCNNLFVCNLLIISWVVVVVKLWLRFWLEIVIGLLGWWSWFVNIVIKLL